MSHIFKSLDNDDMEIGQTTGQDLFMKLNRWGGECKINLNLTGDQSATIQQVSDDELTWTGNKFDFKFEKKTQTIEFVGSKKMGVDFIRNERNGVELFIILKEKPALNYVEFPIDMENLNYYYQPPYTQEQIDAEHTQPPWVTDSYAVYHATKRNHVVGQTNYMAGKAFHIYRPIILDSNSNVIFGELNIIDGKMRIIIDSDFIQNAVYPVTIDPTFGYETQGTDDYQDCEDYIYGQQYRNTIGTGVGNSISACLYINNQKLKCAIYDGSSPAGYIQTTDERTDIAEKVKDFYTFNFSSPPTVTYMEYYGQVCWGDQTGGGGYGRLYYDDAVSAFGNIEVSSAYGSWPATLAVADTDKRYSIYCTFTLSPTFIPKVIMIT